MVFLSRPGAVDPPGGILPSVRGEAFFPQAGVHKVVDQAVQAGADRHAEEHSHHAEESAPHQDGDDDPQAGKTRGVAQNLGADDVAVQLLERQDENDKV